MSEHGVYLDEPEDQLPLDIDEIDGPPPLPPLQPSVLLARLMIQEALREHPDLLATARSPGAVIVLEVPAPAWGADIETAWRALTGVVASDVLESTGGDDLIFRINGGRKPTRPSPLPALLLPALEPERRPGGRSDVFLRALQEGRAVHAISHDPGRMLPPEVLEAADHQLAIPHPDGAMLLDLVTDLCLMEEGPVELPPERLIRRMRPLDLLMARRPGQRAQDLLRRLDVILQGREGSRGPGLDALHGMGSAMGWGCRAAADLQACREGELDPAELDRGVVLEGPPGCGKTTFARAVAESAGVPFISSSLQQWQGSRDGHLGSLLGAMRATFAEARSQAPCVLLIDEIDGFGSRGQFDAGYRDYARQVVNGLLEELDGAARRDGVLVIGCTNDASGIDPAILRSGRLEQIVQVPLPDVRALQVIFRQHLDGDLARADLHSLSEVAYSRGASGADVQRWCRSARGTARRARRGLVLADLSEQVGHPPPALPDEARWRVAVHEAAHALAYIACGPGILKGVEIGRYGGRLGHAIVSYRALVGSPLLTREMLCRQLRALLAGRAAEAELLGSVSAGAGGVADSDLGRATRLATQALASLGLDDAPDGVVWRRVDTEADAERLLSEDPRLRERVTTLLVECDEDARVMASLFRRTIEAIARELVDKGRLDVGEVVELVTRTRIEGVGRRAGRCLEQALA